MQKNAKKVDNKMGRNEREKEKEGEKHRLGVIWANTVLLGKGETTKERWENEVH